MSTPTKKPKLDTAPPTAPVKLDAPEVEAPPRNHPSEIDAPQMALTVIAKLNKSPIDFSTNTETEKAKMCINLIRKLNRRCDELKDDESNYHQLANFITMMPIIATQVKNKKPITPHLMVLTATCQELGWSPKDDDKSWDELLPRVSITGSAGTSATAAIPPAMVLVPPLLSIGIKVKRVASQNKGDEMLGTVIEVGASTFTIACDLCKHLKPIPNNWLEEFDFSDLSS